jgi:hypothetical protein
MLESRRHALSVCGTFLGLLSAGALPALMPEGVFGQNAGHRRIHQSPGLDGGTTEFDNPGGDKPSPAPKNVQYQSALRSDVEKLCTMVTELKDQVVHINPHDTLSVAFLKKAQAIEKLAKQIQDHARG